MVHTAHLIQQITKEEYRTITTHKEYKTITEEAEMKHRYLNILANKGIRNISAYQIYGQSLYYCECIINLQRIVNNGERTTKIFISESDLPRLYENFSQYISAVLPLRKNLDKWGVKRIDYTVDLHLTPQLVKQYIILLQRGDKNYSWIVSETPQTKELREKQHRSKKETTHPQGSVLYQNKQYKINIYDKELERKHRKEYSQINDCKGVLRIEVQETSKNKLKSIKRYIKLHFDYEFEGKPLKCFANHDVSDSIITSAFRAIAGNSDYVTLPKAKDIIKKSKNTRRAKACMIKFIEDCNQLKSVWKAKKIYNGDISITTVLNRLKELNINPVTIPASFRTDNLDNLFKVLVSEIEREGENQP